MRAYHKNEAIELNTPKYLSFLKLCWSWVTSHNPITKINPEAPTVELDRNASSNKLMKQKKKLLIPLIEKGRSNVGSTQNWIQKPSDIMRIWFLSSSGSVLHSAGISLWLHTRDPGNPRIIISQDYLQLDSLGCHMELRHCGQGDSLPQLPRPILHTALTALQYFCSFQQSAF